MTTSDPAAYATTLDATADAIDQMSMDDRLVFLRSIREGPAAAQLGASDRWRNLEGVITFFRDQAMGTPGTWVSLVNAGVLEGVQRGLAIASGHTDDFGNPGARAWADYLARLSRKELTTTGEHDRAWGVAKQVSTHYGVLLAEQVRGLKPTPEEQRFLTFAEFYNWSMQNRPVLNMMISLGEYMDPRLQGIQPEFVDWFINVGDEQAARVACEIAWRLAHELRPGASGFFGLLHLALAEVPQLLETYRHAPTGRPASG
ncbi:hypothetical protein [Nonomuraea sp. KM90]|uniref:hypothetical protein n=1 Tax=Nonomuraea sp. KM90 TaxID=3457428 RepID=UPI003FCEC018